MKLSLTQANTWVPVTVTSGRFVSLMISGTFGGAPIVAQIRSTEAPDAEDDDDFIDIPDASYTAATMTRIWVPTNSMFRAGFKAATSPTGTAVVSAK